MISHLFHPGLSVLGHYFLYIRGDLVETYLHCYTYSNMHSVTLKDSLEYLYQKLVQKPIHISVAVVYISVAVVYVYILTGYSEH